MNKKLFLSAAAGIILLSCSDAVVETDGYNSPIETKANLTVKVHDAVTGTMLSQGTQIIFPDRVGKQLPTGAFVFEDVYVGTYNITVSAGAGYATVNSTVSIGANPVENVHIARENVALVSVYPLTASLEGHVYYPNKEGVNVPAKDVEVQLHFTGASCVLHKRIYPATAITGADGKYVIDGLPAIGPSTQGCAYSLYALGGTTGIMPFQTAALTGGATFDLSSGTTSNNAGIRVISNNTSVFVVSSYNEVVADTLRDSSVTFIFSDKIDKQTVEIGTVKYGTEIAEVVWTDNSVTLKPTGRWSNDFNVVFTGLKSVTGKALTQTSYLVIVHKPNISRDTVTGLKVNNWLEEFGIIGPTAIAQIGRQDSVADFNTSIQLSWAPVKGAEDGYDVFVKYETESNYKKITSVGEKDTVASVNLGVLSPIEDQKLRFLVQAKNSQFVSVLDDRKALPVSDNCSPIKRVEYDTTLVPAQVPETVGTFVQNWSLGASIGASTVDKTHKLVITFDEDMNINTRRLAADSLILGDIIDNDLLKAAARLKLSAKPTYEWTGEKELTVYVVVKSGIAAATDLDAKFSITGLKDKSGNPFLSEFNEKNSKDDVTGLYTNFKRKEGLIVRITSTVL